MFVVLFFVCFFFNKKCSDAPLFYYFYVVLKITKFCQTTILFRTKNVLYPWQKKYVKKFNDCNGHHLGKASNDYCAMRFCRHEKDVKKILNGFGV